MWNHIMDGSQVLEKSIIMTVYQKSDYICSITSTVLFLLGVRFKLPLSGLYNKFLLSTYFENCPVML